MKAAKQPSTRKSDNENAPSGRPDDLGMTNPTKEETNMKNCFAVFPDGAATPAAVFADLEDAMDWGLERYGCDAFGIRHFDMAQVESAERHGAPGPV